MKPSFTSIARPNTILFFLFCTGIVLSNVTVPFPYGLEWYFAGVAAWYALRYVSVPAGAAVAFVGAAAGVFLWGNSPLLALLPLEVLAVGWWMRKRNGASIIVCDLLFWATAGWLLYGISYFWLNASVPAFLPLYLLFQFFGAFVNVVLGEIAADMTPTFASGKPNPVRWRIEPASLQLCVVLLLLPFLLFLYSSSYFLYAETVSAIADRMETVFKRVDGHVKQLSGSELRDFRMHSTLQKAALHDVFDQAAEGNQIRIILIDDDGHMMLRNDAVDEPVVGVYDWSDGGDIQAVRERLHLKMPQAVPAFDPASRWAASEFIGVYELERVPYRLIIKESAAPYQQTMFRLFSTGLAATSILFFAFGSFAIWATRTFSRSLTGLARFSSGLPEKIRNSSDIDWQDSRLHEMNVLKHNFIDMATELSHMFRELDESKEKLSVMLHYDPLTGLGNRYSFGQYFPEVIERSRAQGTKAACLFIDLDRFKAINDTLGHEAGDAVLQAVGKRLAKFRGDAAKPFRLAGDEFVVVLSDPLPNDLQAWGETVRLALTERRVDFRGAGIELNFSAGIAVYPDHGSDAGSLLRSADQAMYAAKMEGRNRIRLLDAKRPAGKEGTRFET